MATETNLEKLQRLLRDMFQFDCADLDFGIYRIMNHKRDAVERFIRKDLVEAISKEPSSGILASQFPGRGRVEGPGRTDPRVHGRSRPQRRRQLEQTAVCRSAHILLRGDEQLRLHGETVRVKPQNTYKPWME